MQVVHTITSKHNLEKTMPQGVLRMVTAEEHNQKFYAFAHADVWTSEGWLITAVQEDGVTHHMRKGTEIMVAKLDPQTMLHYVPSQHTKYYLGEEA